MMDEIFKNLIFVHCTGNFCCLLVSYANNLDPDQDGQKVDPYPNL